MQIGLMEITKMPELGICVKLVDLTMMESKSRTYFTEFHWLYPLVTYFGLFSILTIS